MVYIQIFKRLDYKLTEILLKKTNKQTCLGSHNQEMQSSLNHT